MKTVNLYIASSIHGPAHQKGRYLYILEVNTEKGPATLTDKKVFPETTENQAVVYALGSALAHLRSPCCLEIYTDCVYLASALTRGWLSEWKYAGWQNRRGFPIKYAEKWQEISNFLDAHKFTVHLKETHTYKAWMDREVKTDKGYI